MLEGIDVLLGVDNFSKRMEFESLAKTIIFKGAIDSYFDYCFGALEYRKVKFETEILDTDNYQGVAVMNFTDINIPYTRIIEHKHFLFGKQPKTVISKEFSTEWKFGDDPYYPVNDTKNQELYNKYKIKSEFQSNVIFGGRLGCYRYCDMDKTIEEALKCAAKVL